MKWGLSKRNHQPQNGIDRFRNEMNNFFDDFLSFKPLSLYDNDWSPSMDVIDGEKSINVKADLPGLDQKDIELTIENGVLTISGQKSEEKRDETKNYLVSERRFGSFVRSIRLPIGIRHEDISAEFKDGVLSVEIPKDEKIQPKKIDVKVN
jgi:HSP20 family protein